MHPLDEICPLLIKHGKYFLKIQMLEIINDAKCHMYLHDNTHMYYLHDNKLRPD